MKRGKEMKTKRIFRGVFALLLCAAVLVGACTACSSASSGAPGSKTATMAIGAGEKKSVAQADRADATPEAGLADGTTNAVAPAAQGTANGTETGSNPTEGAAAAASGQKIIERLSYQIETLKFDDSVKKIQSLCTDLGGYEQDSNISGNDSIILQQGNLRQASFTLRIPQEKLSQLKTRAAEIGSILNSSSSSENISEQYFDTEARLKSLRTQQERLLALLQKSGSLTDVIALEKALADVNYQIEQLTGSLRQYDSLINFSTVSIQLNEVVKTTELEKTPVTVGDKIAQQFKASLHALVAFGEGLLVFFVGGAPIILLLAVIAVVVIFIIRKRKKRLTKKNADITKPAESADSEHTEK
jgi:hypothetical protein